jgi:FkbM family methyltransferase
MSLTQPVERAAMMQPPVARRSLKKTLARQMDRPGGRFLLGKLVSQYARRTTGDDLEISYRDGLWIHRAGPYFFPDGPKFDHLSGMFSQWKNQIDQYVSDTNEYWLRHYHPKEGDVIVDVGAGRGEDTLTFSRGVGESGRVIAIEAHPFSFEILENFCRLNRLRNVTPLHLALMDKPGKVHIAESESWTENSVVYGVSTGMEVPAGTLDDICCQQGLNEIAFLKMNIEGAERYALLGMASTMRHLRHICIACHDFRYQQGHGERFRTRAFVKQFLSDNGFTFDSRPDDPRASVPDHIFGLRPRE